MGSLLPLFFYLIALQGNSNSKHFHCCRHYNHSHRHVSQSS